MERESENNVRKWGNNAENTEDENQCTALEVWISKGEKKLELR